MIWPSIARLVALRRWAELDLEQGPWMMRRTPEPSIGRLGYSF